MDDATEFNLGFEPMLCKNPQPAGDVVIFFILIPLGGRVSRHAISDLLVIELPGNTDMIWVETRGHTDQRLPYFPIWFVSVSALIR